MAGGMAKPRAEYCFSRVKGRVVLYITVTREVMMGGVGRMGAFPGTCWWWGSFILFSFVLKGKRVWGYIRSQDDEKRRMMMMG